jgi:prefoldin subunit 5
LKAIRHGQGKDRHHKRKEEMDKELEEIREDLDRLTQKIQRRHRYLEVQVAFEAESKMAYPAIGF